MKDTCILCGADISDSGRMVCPNCEAKMNLAKKDTYSRIAEVLIDSKDKGLIKGYNINSQIDIPSKTETIQIKIHKK